MIEETKYQIVLAASQYIKEKNLSQNEVARLSGINSGYLSNMLNQKFIVSVKGKDVEIADRWFYQLSDWAQLPFKKQVWEVIPTRQFSEILAQLEYAKKTSSVITLVADTGLGKTYIIDRFQHRHPRQCVKVTINSTYKLKDILAAICDKIGVETSWSTSQTLTSLIEKFKELKRNGEKMIIIIDEAENMQLPVLKMLKGLYDGIKGYTSIALIATDQLIHTLDRMRRKDATGIPQLFRRLKAGIRHINNHNEGFKPFFEKYIPNDKALQKLLLTLCSNYGELHDYLEPVLREAFETDQPVTEHMFRLYHNLPNY